MTDDKEWAEEMRKRRRRSEWVDSLTQIGGFALSGLFAVLVLGVVIYFKNWRYEECLSVGHTEAWCQAEYVGCGGRR